MINLIILTGVFGAGRTIAMKSLEEEEYFTIDNLPFMVAKSFFDTIANNEIKYRNVAMSVANIEALDFFNLAKTYRNFKVTLVGITCSDEVLKERYRLENKLHPLQIKGLSLESAIKKDKETVRSLTDYYDVLIDSSKLTNNELKKALVFNVLEEQNKFIVNIFTFGYKRTLPQDIETVFDVRILKNPYWEKKLKDLSGKDEEVINFVMSDPNTKKLLDHITSYLNYYFATLKQDGRRHANIGIACSSGRHRSVVIADYLAKKYSKDYKVSVVHRDINNLD